MRSGKNSVSVVKELALRLVKLCVGEDIWQYEHGMPEGCDMSSREVSAALRLAGELELRNPEVTVVRMGRAKCNIRVTADVARTIFSKKTERVSAKVRLEKWEKDWDSVEVSFNFRREQVTTEFEDFEESSIPPLLPQKPRRVPKEKPVVVTLERFETEKDQMLIRVEGGYGIGGEYSQNQFYGLLMDLVDDLTVTSRLVSIEKDEADWPSIIPMLRKRILSFFWPDTKIVERMQRSVPQEDDEFLGETEMESIRESMRGCALTKDEREAIGMSDAEYEDGLR